jgi:tetraacyldisaccharide-1-P 4'-kinase
LQTFAKQCLDKGAQVLLCTEKDYVKLASDVSCELPVVPVEMQLKVDAGKEHWENLLKHILDRVVK